MDQSVSPDSQGDIHVTVFMYLATKAAHLELVSDLTPSAFVTTLWRIM